MVTFFVISLFIVPIAIKIFADDYIAHENEKMVNCLSRFRKGLDFFVDSLDATSSDWAAWDDLYYYVKNKNNDFIEKNIYPAVFKKFGVHFIMIFDSTGEIVFADLYNDDISKKIEIDKSAAADFIKKIMSSGTGVQMRSLKGVSGFQEDIMLFACRPILTSEAKGTPAGRFIMGRYFKNQLLDQLFKLTFLKTDLINIERFINIKENVSVYNQIKSQGAYIEITKDLIKGYSFLYDPYNRPAAVFKITNQLTIYGRGIYAVKIFIIIFFIIIIISLIINYFIINKLFIKRIMKIYNKIKNISGSSGSETNAAIPSSDELSELASEINYTLHKIKTSFEELERSRALLEIKAAEADSASRLKSRFLAVISHEIRTPMNSVIGFCDLMSDTPLDSEQKKMLSHIKISGKLLLNLLNNLLDFSKIEANKLTIENLEFNIYDMVIEVYEMLIISAYNKKNELKYSIDDKIKYYLYGDMLKLRQVLMNLAGNAVKFTDNGLIMIRIEMLSETSEEIEVKISVEDNGIGIAPDKISNIFSPFIQAEKMINRKYGGTGLGLSIANELVKLMGGDKISVNSVENKGSLFYFVIKFKKGDLLPVKNNSSHYAEKKCKKIIGGHIKILFADDDDFNRELGLKTLGSAGCEVTAVRDGKEVLEKVEIEKYDIIIIDVQMPIVNGIQATKALREKGVNIPVIAVTAFVFKEVQDECLNAGINAVISKPINSDELIDEIIRLVPRALVEFKTRDDFAIKTGAGEEIIKTEEPPSLSKKRAPMIFNYEKTLLNIGKSEQLLITLINRFKNSYMEYLGDIEAANNAGDIEKLGFYAHKFKGFALIAGAEKLGGALGELEKAAKKNDLTAGRLLETVKKELECYLQAINELKN